MHIEVFGVYLYRNQLKFILMDSELKKDAMDVLKHQEELTKLLRQPLIELNEIRIIRNYWEKHPNSRYTSVKQVDSESSQPHSLFLFLIVALSCLSFVLGILGAIILGF